MCAACGLLDMVSLDCYISPIKIMPRRPMQLSLPTPPTWGGRRAGAGRKPAPGRRPGVPHRRRPEHTPAHPVHVTLRAVDALRCLRSDRVFPAVRRALTASSRTRFRVLQFTVQTDHVHLIVEADDRKAFSGGVRGLTIRLARAINRALRRRGRVWGDRFHARALSTPRAVRHALVYVLMNTLGPSSIRAHPLHGSLVGAGVPHRCRRAPRQSPSRGRGSRGSAGFDMARSTLRSGRRVASAAPNLGRRRARPCAHCSKCALR